MERDKMPKRTKTLDELMSKHLTPEDGLAIRSEVRATALALELAIMRKALKVSQKEAATRMGMTQSELSKLERRGDNKWSTLVRYAEALGAKLEVNIVMGNRRVALQT